MGLQPEFNRGFMQFSRFMAEVKKNLDTEAIARLAELIIEKDGTHIASVVVDRLPFSKTIGPIEPGHYEFRLDTGWVLWEGEFTDTDLTWTAAFPGQPLAMAADTGKRRVGKYTKKLRLLNGEIVIRAFPGLESGYLEIDVVEESHA